LHHRLLRRNAATPFTIRLPGPVFPDHYNPLCGDHYTLDLIIENGKIIDIGFRGQGCAISKSSASIMTTCLKGTSIEAAKKFCEKFCRMLKEEDETVHFTDVCAKLEALRGVKAFPTRIKCATLIWHALRSALEGNHIATTEK
jgi:nitrogen fixation NifU-like protein